MVYVSRAGAKLEYALKSFQISAKDLVCADFGSSTGGFVDCLLQFGAKKVFAVELNPVAVSDMKENIKLNKVEGKVEAIPGNVRKIVPKLLAGKCDRVLMPLPKDAELFLQEAIACLKPEGGIVHFYSFGKKQAPFDNAIGQIHAGAKEASRKIKIMEKKELREYSPDTVQVVVDFRVF